MIADLEKNSLLKGTDSQDFYHIFFAQKPSLGQKLEWPHPWAKLFNFTADFQIVFVGVQSSKVKAP